MFDQKKNLDKVLTKSENKSSNASPVAIKKIEATPQQDKTSAKGKDKIQISPAFGKIVLALLKTPRYQNHSVADLTPLILEPLSRNKIAMAYLRSEEGLKKSRLLAGIAIWASVSEAVDQKIRGQVQNNIFPIQLEAEDWQSGDKIWLLDIIAPSPKLTEASLFHFYKLIKHDDIHLHPAVAAMVDPEFLEKVKVATVSSKINF